MKNGQTRTCLPDVRWIERVIQIEENIGRVERVLQQSWQVFDGKRMWIEWVDVPIEKAEDEE